MASTFFHTDILNLTEDRYGTSGQQAHTNTPESAAQIQVVVELSPR